MVSREVEALWIGVRFPGVTPFLRGSSVVERLAVNQNVAGSIPALGTNCTLGVMEARQPPNLKAWVQFLQGVPLRRPMEIYKTETGLTVIDYTEAEVEAGTVDIKAEIVKAGFRQEDISFTENHVLTGRKRVFLRHKEI